MKKRLVLILSISAAGVVVLVVAVLIYNLQVREMAEKSISIPLISTPISSFPLKNEINGLKLETTISLLENNDFICSDKPEVYRDLYYRLSCEQKSPDYDMTIHIFTSDQQNIILIFTQFSQLKTPSNDQAVNFLGFIAHLPIAGMDAAPLKDWITSTLPALDQHPGLVVNKTLDGLKLSLYGPPNSRSLEIIENN